MTSNLKDDLLKAQNTKSMAGEFCRILGLLIGIIGSLIVLGVEGDKYPSERDFSGIVSCLAGGAILSAFGDNASSHKKTVELVLVIAKAQVDDV